MKHEALMSDIDTFNTVIHNLREQSQDCKVREYLHTLHFKISPDTSLEASSLAND